MINYSVFQMKKRETESVRCGAAVYESEQTEKRKNCQVIHEAASAEVAAGQTGNKSVTVKQKKASHTFVIEAYTVFYTAEKVLSL